MLPMSKGRLAAIAFVVLAVVLGTLLLEGVLGVLGRAGLLGDVNLPDTAQNFVTVFLGIFIEAAPFLLIGTIASGLIAVYVTPETIARMVPRNRLLAPVAGALMGMVFPVCECGAVPVARRLYRKGLPSSVGIAFLLAAPVINPIVIASTYAAFGFGPVFWGRIAFTLLVAIGIGVVFSVEPNVARILRPRSFAPVIGGKDDGPVPPRLASVPRTPGAPRTLGAPDSAAKLQAALGIASDEFFDMGRYLVIGALIATTLQTFVPQQTLVSIGGGSVSSVIALQALAFVLSVCSTVDSFLALSFVNTFTTGAIIAFLVFGPMVDIKSLAMYFGVFRPRVVIYLVLIAFLVCAAIGVFVNLNLGW